MELANGGTCEICGKETAVIHCDGCNKKLCERCRRFDLWCYGCGHGDPKAFCERCYNDPAVNLWRQG